MHARSIAWPRVLATALASAALTALAACGAGTSAARPPAPLPTSINCADAPALRQRAADDRRLIAELKSDQEKTSTGNRANFFASLAIIADLKCKVTTVQVDENLKKALDAARKATDASSFYERANAWNEANLLASSVISGLVTNSR